MEDTEELQIWTMVHHKSLGPIVMEWNGVIIAPFAFTSYDEASFALADDTLPEDLKDEITVVPESYEEFKAKVLTGFSNIIPKQPDAFSLNTDPSNVGKDLLPLTEKGATIIDTVMNCKFWGHLDMHPSLLRKYSAEMLGVSAGVVPPN